MTRAELKHWIVGLGALGLVSSGCVGAIAPAGDAGPSNGGEADGSIGNGEADGSIQSDGEAGSPEGDGGPTCARGAPWNGAQCVDTDAGMDTDAGTTPKLISYDFSDADRVFKDGTPVAQLTSESDRVFRTDELIRMRPVDTSTFEIVNFIPVDLRDVTITLSIDGGPSDVKLMHITHLPAHAIAQVKYPFLTYTEAKFVDELGALVDLAPYRGGVPAGAATFDFSGDDAILQSLDRVRTVGWKMKIHDFDANNDLTDNWLEDPTARHARLITQHMINLAYIWTDPRMKERLQAETIVGNDGVTALTAQEKLDVYASMLGDRRLDLGVVANVSGLGGGTTFGVAEYILTHDFLYGSQDGSQFHEMGHVLGYGHDSSMTYPDSQGRGFTPMCMRLALDLFTAGELVINQANYYKREDHQVHCSTQADCPWYMACTGTIHSDGSYKYCE